MIHGHNWFLFFSYNSTSWSVFIKAWHVVSFFFYSMFCIIGERNIYFFYITCIKAAIKKSLPHQPFIFLFLEVKKGENKKQQHPCICHFNRTWTSGTGGPFKKSQTFIYLFVLFFTICCCRIKFTTSKCFHIIYLATDYQRLNIS